MIWFRWLCFSLLFLTGCELTQDPRSLMSAPMLSEDKESLWGQITSQLPEGAVLIHPRTMKDTATIHITDLGQDGGKQAIVFYSTENKEMSIHGMIWEKERDTWVKKCDFDGAGTELSSFEMVDVTGDGKLELVVGYATLQETELQKGVIVYSYNNHELTRLWDKPYTHYVISDLNQDGFKEITILLFQRDQYSTVTTYAYRDKDFIKVSSLDLGHHDVLNYKNFTAGMIAPHKSGIVVDVTTKLETTAAEGTSEAYYTLVVTMEQDKLIEAIPRKKTAKMSPVQSMDVNKDGIIEIGFQRIPVGWEERSFSQIPYLVQYYQWDGKKKLHLASEQYRGFKVFTLNFPENWRNKVTIDPGSELDQHIIFIHKKTKQTLAELQVFSPEEWEKNKDDWKVMHRTREKLVAIKSEAELESSLEEIDENEIELEYKNEVETEHKEEEKA